MDEFHELGEVHAQLLYLCEEQSPSVEAELCVMEAFNVLTELDASIPVFTPSACLTTDRVRRTLELLDGVLQRSRQLEQTLALMRVRDLVSQALGSQP